MTPGPPPALDLTTALADLQQSPPSEVIGTLTTMACSWARDLVLYLVDYEQEILQPYLDGSSMVVYPEEPVASTLAGRAYATGQAVSAERADGVRVWLPVFEHSVRSGVLAVTVDEDSAEVRVQLDTLASVAGLLVASAARYTDLVHVRKRGRSMTLAASMQWDLLPPLTLRTDTAVVSGLLEPAYEVAGDGFDHAVNGERVDVALFDGMGHGIGSTLLTTLALGTYRHQRRERQTLARTHAVIDRAVAQQFAGDAFVTGLLARLDAGSGQLEVCCAGHPAPLLLRGRQVVGELSCPVALPWGLHDQPGDSQVETTVTTLEPDDIVVLYTDGMVEGRDRNGREFGVERLGDLLEREAASGRLPEEVLRRLVRAVVEHQAGVLRDDATAVLLQWTGPTHDVIPHQSGQPA